MREAFSEASIAAFTAIASRRGGRCPSFSSPPSPLFCSTHLFLFDPPERGRESGANSEAREGPGHRGEEWFKHAEEGWVEGRVGGRKLPLVSELEAGQDGQEYFGAHWLKPEICKPCSASCFLFWGVFWLFLRVSCRTTGQRTGDWWDREGL